MIDQEQREAARSEGSPAPPVKIFINYRRSDTQQDARLLYRDLVPKYGAENIFFDRVNLEQQTGKQWLDEIKASANSSGVFLALIGPRWSSIIAAKEGGEDDIVKVEIETALAGADITVVPVLIDGHTPDATKLPPSLSRLIGAQGVPVRQDHWDQDVQRLIEKIDEIAARPKQPIAKKPSPPRLPPPDPSRPQVAPAPPAAHYQKVLDFIVKGTLVPILGSGVNASDRGPGWTEGCGYLPDADELAAGLARRARIEPEDLARIAQYVAVTDGWQELSSALAEILGSDCPPSSVHEFFATLRRTLADLGMPDRYQLIVTTNYDDALERAFKTADEPYDLAVYMANGESGEIGKFVHVPYDGARETIDSPNDYNGLPVRYNKLTRTVIVKIHGAVAIGDKNYVVTEDQYIDYLSGGPVVQFVPMPILKKLRESHCLFLGYTMSDWNLRVFLKRIWEGRSLQDQKSWAVERDPDELEKEFWAKLSVELFDASLADYVSDLAAHLQALEGTPATA